MLIFDACRDSLTFDKVQTIGLTRRNWRVEGHLITAYPDKWGPKTVDDGVYAAGLASWMSEPHDSVEQVFNRVQEDVWQRSERSPEYLDQHASTFVYSRPLILIDVPDEGSLPIKA